ncbi:hypothetical protein [Salinicola rhizosphaerae]|uniref:Uncharacterized protein n=1 Tax=Salinicola rhizosphaerae TaxID=1443141 RepID=A0ABQ3DR42_9GAMM|nr:hypothetical protein [Salinicola rhizosphaerae]GHB12842.1 hypothetical protein GCM10009038_08570 [Salinicola rhizosphaerae]
MIYNNNEIGRQSKKYIYQAVLGTTVLTYGAGAVADGWEQVDSREFVEAYVDYGDTSFNLNKFIQAGKVNINNDFSIVTTQLSPEEVATSSIVSFTNNQPVVMGMFDGANDMGTIVVVNMKRHPDGSATLYQRFVSPYYFDSREDGGEMSKAQMEIINDRFGGNPFENFKTTEDEYKRSFVKIKPYGLQTAMGIFAQHMGATVGVFCYLEPRVRVWTTSSGGPFRKKITTHVEARFKPSWALMTPADIGNDFGTVEKPFYILKNGKTVISGMNIHPVDDGKNPHYGEPGESKYMSSFPQEDIVVFYDKRSKSGWTGITLIAVSFAIGYATGGIGLASSGLWGGAMGAMATAGFGAINGNTNFTDVSTTNLTQIDAISDTESLKKEGDWAMKWKNVMRDLGNEGPLGKNLGDINAEFAKEKKNWDKRFTEQNKEWNELK